jgi:hypothetical protein
MQKLHTFNQNLPDSLQIREHFTDMLSWKYWAPAYYDTLLNGNNILKYKRDSLMAQVVIDWYEQTPKKCLVVTNYRHAFAVKNNINSKKHENEGQYIYEKFPEKTANVLIYGHRYNGIFTTPVQHGLWNRVMKENGNIPVGFNFENSPFGVANFDMFPAFHRNYYNYSYQNVFTGYIFNKPETEFTFSQPCYSKYAADKEYEWALQNHLIDTVKAKILYNRYQYQDKDGKMDLETDIALYFYMNAYHVVDLVVWAFWSIIVFLLITGNVLITIVMKKY